MLVEFEGTSVLGGRILLTEQTQIHVYFKLVAPSLQPKEFYFSLCSVLSSPKKLSTGQFEGYFVSEVGSL